MFESITKHCMFYVHVNITVRAGRIHTEPCLATYIVHLLTLSMFLRQLSSTGAGGLGPPCRSVTVQFMCVWGGGSRSVGTHWAFHETKQRIVHRHHKTARLNEPRKHRNLFHLHHVRDRLQRRSSAVPEQNLDQFEFVGRVRV